jgi:uncharacterized protein YceH (UPF0502 family)
MSRRIPRQLDPVEIRVLGSLLEKEQTTPEAYPLSLNALVAACGQQTNREPVMRLSAREVSSALERLRQDVLVWRTDGARVERWKQSVERRWDLDPAAKALLTVLFLRGPQTSGQLRQRSERLHDFASLAAVEELLARLASGDEPLIRELPRAPGQKERRWTHLLGSLPSAAEAWSAATDEGEADRGKARVDEPRQRAEREAAGPVPLSLAALSARVERLEGRLDELAAAVRALTDATRAGRQ